MIICVTDQAALSDSFRTQFMRICRGKPDQIILRAKHLDAETYEKLAKECLEIASEYEITLLFHSHIELSTKLGHNHIHLSFGQFIQDYPKLDEFQIISVAIHSVREAQLAQLLGATQVIAGHIYQTDCKKTLAPKGLSFIEEVHSASSIPVMAIGGITPERYSAVLASGAIGACIMSSIMKSSEPEVLINQFRKG